MPLEHVAEHTFFDPNILVDITGGIVLVDLLL